MAAPGYRFIRGRKLYPPIHRAEKNRVGAQSQNLCAARRKCINIVVSVVQNSDVTDLKVAIFGATGMVNQGVLRSLLQDPEIVSVCSIGRSLVAMTHPKLEQVRHADLTEYTPIKARFARFDAVFSHLGISGFRMQEHI